MKFNDHLDRLLAMFITDIILCESEFNVCHAIDMANNTISIWPLLTTKLTKLITVLFTTKITDKQIPLHLPENTDKTSNNSNTNEKPFPEGQTVASQKL